MSPEREQPEMLRLIDEASLLVNRLEDRLSHALLPSYPTEANKTDVSESEVVRRLRNLVKHLGQLNDRVES